MRVSGGGRLELGDVRAAHVPFLLTGGEVGAGNDGEVVHVGTHAENLEHLVVKVRPVVAEDAAEGDVIAVSQRVRPDDVHVSAAGCTQRGAAGVARGHGVRLGAAGEVGRLELVPVLVVLEPSVRGVRRDTLDEWLDVRTHVVPGVHRGIRIGAPLRVVEAPGPSRRLVDADAIVLVDPGAGPGERPFAAAPAEISGEPISARPLNLVEPRRLPVPARPGHLRVAVVPRDANLRPAALLLEPLGHILETDPPRVIARDGEREQRTAG